MQLFVNVSDESVPAQAQFKAAANGIRASVLRVQRRTADGSKTDWQNSPASFERSLALPAREAEAWELEW